jgi:hypothetical protein
MTSKGTQLSESDTKRLKQLAARLSEAKAEQALLNAQLRDLDNKVWQMEFQELPDMMHELGIEETTFKDGIFIKLQMFYKATLPKTKPLREKAFAWLRQNGFGTIIKHEITATFTTGKSKQADGLIKFLEKLGCEFVDGESIHHATLTAFVKEQFEKGNGKLPLDALGAFIGERVTVKSLK